MSFKFSYYYASQAELAHHIAFSASSASVTSARRYYSQLGQTSVVQRIDKARIEAKIARLTQKLASVN
jgi:hypothetical protein